MLKLSVVTGDPNVPWRLALLQAAAVREQTTATDGGVMGVTRR